MSNQFITFNNPPTPEEPKDRSTLIIVIVVVIMVIALIVGVSAGMYYIKKDNDYKPPENTTQTDKPDNNADTQTEFKDNLNLFHESATKFFLANLPEKKGEGITMKLSKFYEESLIAPMKFGGNDCDSENSKSAILKETENEYTILTNLICGNKKDEIKETILVTENEEGELIAESISIPEKIVYYHMVYLGNDITEKITKTIDSEIKMTTITGILNNKTLNEEASSLGGTDIPYLEIIYPSRIVKVSFLSPSTDDFLIDDKTYRINYSGNAYNDILRVFEGTNVTVESNLDLKYYEGLKKASLTTYSVDFETGITNESTKTLTKDIDLKKVAAVLNNAIKYEASGLGGVGIPSLTLTYNNKELIIGLLSQDIISIDGETYKINYKGNDYREDLKTLFAS